MSRAFVSEQDGWNYCILRKKHCKDATLRGECDRERCKYPEEEEQKETTNTRA